MSSPPSSSRRRSPLALAATSRALHAPGLGPESARRSWPTRAQGGARTARRCRTVRAAQRLRRRFFARRAKTYVSVEDVTSIGVHAHERARARTHSRCCPNERSLVEHASSHARPSCHDTHTLAHGSHTAALAPAPIRRRRRRLPRRRPAAVTSYHREVDRERARSHVTITKRRRSTQNSSAKSDAAPDCDDNNNNNNDNAALARNRLHARTLRMTLRCTRTIKHRS